MDKLALVLIIYFARGSLLIHYKFWTSFEQGFQDFSGNSLHAVNGANTSDNTGDIVPTARGAYMTGSAYITAPANSLAPGGFVTGSNFSMTCWILSFQKENLMFEKDSGGYFLIRWRAILNGTVNIHRLRIMVGAVDFYADSTTDVPINVWTLLTVVVQCTATCYVKGYLGLTQNINAVSPNIAYVDSTTYPVMIGRVALGIMYEFRLYTHLLTTTDIAGMMQNPNTGGCPGTCSSACVTSPSVICLSPCTSILVTQSCSPCSCGSNGCLSASPTTCAVCDSTCIQSLCDGTTYSDCTLGQNCSPTCSVCSGTSSSQCVTCSDPNTTLTSGVCACALYFFQSSANPFVCSPCHIDCAACTASGQNKCTSCRGTNAVVSSGTCVCPAGFYTSSTSPVSCQSKAYPACDQTCSLCSVVGAAGCTACKSNAALAGTSPSSCVCVGGFVGVPDSKNCVACNGECATCAGTLNSDCKTCKSNAQLVGTAPSSCVCAPGYYGSPSNCQACDSTCLTCSAGGTSSCILCKGNAHNVATAPSACVCDGGFTGSASSCQACDLTCLTCSSITSGGCTACKPDAHLSAASPAPCACDFGFSGPVSSCQPCDLSCLSCSGLTASSCSSCNPHAHLLAAAPSACGCDAGYYGVPATCLQCDGTCATCVGPGPTSCSSCKPNAHLVTGQCYCDNGYAELADPASCPPCHSDCKRCDTTSNSDCVQCWNNASLIGPAPAGCQCDPGFVGSPSSCQACHLECETCLDTSSTGCVTCKTNARLLSLAPSSCLCPDGFFGGASNCQPCSISCLTCVNSLSTSCLSCALDSSLTSPAPSSCLCDSSFFGPPQSCLPCHPFCLECTLSDQLSCTVCHAHAHLTTLNSCECDDFYSGPADDCQPCDPTCASCGGGTGPSHCISCFPSAFLSGDPPSPCVCVSGFVGIPDPRTCIPCDSVCLECSAVHSCTVCKDNAVLAGSSCGCRPGFYPDPDAAACQQCHPLCLECVGGQADQCSQCRPPGFLAAAAPTTCLCPTDHYLDSSSYLCLGCPSLCRSCVSAWNCTTCADDSGLILTDTQFCECNVGFYRFPGDGACQPCEKGCEMCSFSGCSKCFAGFFLLKTHCFAACPKGYSPSDGICQDVSGSPPIPSLTVSPDNTLTLKFNQRVSKPASNSDLSVSVFDLDLQSYPLTWTVNTTQLYYSFTISLEFTQGQHPPDHSQVVVTFVSPADFCNDFGVEMMDVRLVGQLNPFPQNSTQSFNVTVSASAAVAAQTAIVAAGVSSVFSGSLGSMWTMLNQQQLLSYIPLSEIALPEELSSVLLALSANSFLPNPFSYIDSSGDPGVGYFAWKCGYDSGLFVKNGGVLVGTAGMTVISMVPIWGLTKIGHEGLKRYFGKMLPRFRWGVFIRYWLQVYLDIGIASLLQFSTLPTSSLLSSPLYLMSVFLACMFLLLFLLTPIFLLLFTSKHSDAMTSQSDVRLNGKWGALYTEFRPGERLTAVYYFVFTVRRLLFAMSLFLFPKVPKLQAVVHAVTSTTVGTK